MKHIKYTRFLLSTAVLFTSAVYTANAAVVTSMTLADVGSGLPGEYSSVLDGFSGAFRFGNINDTTYGPGVSLFYGDIAASPGSALGEIDTSQSNPIQSFTSGFVFAGLPFIPTTTGPIVADITVSGGVPTLTFDSFPFAGEFGQPGSGTEFLLGSQLSEPADCANAPGTWAPMTVHWLQQIDANHFAYKIGWSHCITADESASFGGVMANWRLEGIATTAVPLPAAVWLFGSGLIGLIGVGRLRAST